MELMRAAIPIERDAPILRARRTAAVTRAVLGLIGIALIAAQPSLLPDPALAIVGFATIPLTSFVQLIAPRLSWMRIEESIAGIAAITIVGLGDQQVSILTLLWLAAVVAGVLARGGRVHWIGRTVVLFALALPVFLEGRLSADHAALCVATVGLLLTSGRLTRELNRLLGEARQQAESAETLLLAGDIASRVVGGEPRADGSRATTAQEEALTPGEAARAQKALARLITGEDVAMAMQPIVDLRTGAVHAYEALARFGRRRSDKSPLYWLELADELGERGVLERTCLRLSLDLFAQRPEGTLLSVNLSVPVLLEAATLMMLARAGERRRDGLEGLIVEITEETLVDNDVELERAFGDLRERGARLAVDDMGAGYSGLRQITTVLPDYLKLDRSLVCGIDRDGDRAALVRALVGYSRNVGSLLVAEGVEHGSELCTLQRLGVPLVQGYYLGRPGKPWPVATAAALQTLRTAPSRPAEASRRSLQPV